MISSILNTDDIPNNWKFKELSDLTNMKGGTSADQNEDKIGIPVTRIETISDGYIDSDSVNHIDIDKGSDIYKKHIMQEGDILFSNINSPEHVGKTALYDGTPNELLHGMNLILVRANQKMINPKYLHRCFQWLRSEGLFKNMCKTAINQASLAQKDIKTIELPVPPLNEQERIVEVAEGRLERVERLEKSVENVGKLTEEYENSLLSYLFTGRSLSQEEVSDSEEWFGQIPKDWEIKTINEVGSRISSMTEPESGEKYSLYSFDSVDEGSGYYEVDGRKIGSRKRELNGGEVMISRLNPRINRVQKIEFKHEYSPIASSEFVAIDVGNYVSREYLYEYLRNPILKERLTNHVTGSTGSRSRVGFDFVMNSKIPVPPKNKQEEIVEEIRKFNFDILEKSHSDLYSLFDEYRDSVLSHSLRGKVDY